MSCCRFFLYNKQTGTKYIFLQNIIIDIAIINVLNIGVKDYPYIDFRLKITLHFQDVIKYCVTKVF